MRRPPENDYDAHVRLQSKRWVVFCVECDHWHPVVILATVQVRIVPGVRRSQKQFDDVSFACGGCSCDVNYLLDSTKRLAILQLARMDPREVTYTAKAQKAHADRENFGKKRPGSGR